MKSVLARIGTILSTAVLLLPCSASSRESITLKTGWLFQREASHDAAKPDFDDSKWRKIRVPHDWAIAGPFARENDIQITQTIEDGEKEPVQRTGRTGGLPHVGEAWYRTPLDIGPADNGRRISLEFDGVMSRSTVYVNGTKIGSWPYGYSSFQFDITDALDFEGKNLLAVHVDNPPAQHRWYPGAGIYRNVRLVKVSPVHIAHWGTSITTPTVTSDSAAVRVETTLANTTGNDTDLKLRIRLLDPAGNSVGEATSPVNSSDSSIEVSQSITVESPRRWDILSPDLYVCETELLLDDTIIDFISTPFGIRTIRFDAKSGFHLNERPVKFKGVCMHHDLGALGAAVNRRAMERQLEILKEAGVNAIRISHNPPDPAYLDLCDRMGFVVINESYDEWTMGKVPHGYHELFPEWGERDLAAMILRDRNHPSIVMWSLGNEIRDAREPLGAEIGKKLHALARKLDPTRPTTMGLNHPDPSIKFGLAEILDIPGWNYKPRRYAEFRKALPDKPLYGSETASTVSSRGIYKFPAKIRNTPIDSDNQFSAYGLDYAGWGTLPDVEFAAQDDNPDYMGEFVWTGFDYLGEPTPYQNHWPSRSSYFGFVDLAGLPKDLYHLYRARWSEKPTVHLLPHWTWPDRVGQVTPVHCFTSGESAELFLNGKSLGKRKKDPESELDRYRLRWDNVVYQPGTLRVIAYEADGKTVGESTVTTAGEAAGMKLTPDRAQITADGDDLSFVTVDVVDAEGRLNPTATHRIEFKLEGPGEILAVDNGDATDLDPFPSPSRKAFSGKCVVIIRSMAGKPGILTLTAAADGLKPASTNLQSR